MQRRKFLAGVGSLAAGSAAAMGTGAFTSVSAERTFTVSTAGDGDAFLKFEKATNSDGGTTTITENAQEYVSIPEDGTLSIDISNTDDEFGSGSGGSGVNKNATTIFDDLFDIVNQGTQTVLVGVTSSPDGLGVYSEGADAASDDATQDDASAMNFDGSTVPEQELAPGERLQNVGVYVTDASTVSSGTITFRAEAVNNND